MPRILSIPQTPLKPIGSVQAVEKEVELEPTIRRARPEFAYEHGGPILKRFLDMAKAGGYVHHNSLVMSQPCDFKVGALSTPQYWHFDFTPGVISDTNEEFERSIYGNTGLILCAFDTREHPDDIGTVFLQGDDITLDLEKRDKKHEYIPGQNLNKDINEGEVYWWDTSVRAQMETNKNLTPLPLQPNAVYEYGSQNIHRVPVMRSNQGQRVLIRINTPINPNELPNTANTVLHQTDPDYPRYVFYETGPDTWKRKRY